MATTGQIGVTSENIFPIIKKFLYSEHDIFLRELVSNAVDATTKLTTIARTDNSVGELGDLSVRVDLDKEAKTITITDRGVGMTQDEIDRYINQIAFSGAEEFLKKYEGSEAAIIGHFGLGFYSAFMVAHTVEIDTLSYKPGAEAVHWSCDGSPEYTLTPSSRTDRGTTITLHVDEDSLAFLEKEKIGALLDKYCRFLPIPILFGKKEEWKDGKMVPTDEDNQINDTNPLWVRTPNDLKEEDYKEFYRSLYPTSDEPLFWIHLNVDYPFTLKGVLFFPDIKPNVELQKNRIKLFCNQVFVTDQVEGIVPEFLTLLHGVIDSPDIPLNVSRSYLQSDANVKKISTYITKKVADRLQSIFKEDRKAYEEKWDNLKLFINYGMLSHEDFYNRAKDFALFKDVDGKYFTFEEYKTLIQGEQTDKDGMLVYLYANNVEEQYTYIEAAKNKGYNVLLLDGDLDTPIVSMLEQKFEKSRFTRVDADIVDRLIVKDDQKKSELAAEDSENLSQVFRSQMPKLDKAEFNVEVQALGENGQPVVITQNEYMRRMKQMSQFQPGMSFYQQMPDSYTLVLNSDHALVKQVLADCNSNTAEALKPILSELKGQQARLDALHQSQDKKKPEELTQEEKDDLQNTEKAVNEQKSKKTEVLDNYAKGNNVIHQLIDLALLQNGMLKGKALDEFLKRSVEMIK